MSNFSKNDPTEGEGVYFSQFLKVINEESPSLIHVCANKSFKKTGNGGKSSFWSPPVSLGSTKFSKTCITYLHNILQISLPI